MGFSRAKFALECPTLAFYSYIKENIEKKLWPPAGARGHIQVVLILAGGLLRFGQVSLG